MAGRRTSSRTSPAPALLPDDDDLLKEILLRLPPQRSSLPRASLVCKRWLGVVSDPGFLRRFRAHHREPPLLGFFTPVGFTPTLEPPDRIPAERFSLPEGRLFDCRHGLVLLDRRRLEALVWEPITGHERRVAYPPDFIKDVHGSLVAAVLCAAGGDHGHVHGDCPFKLVVVRNEYERAFACLYESESGLWGNIISTAKTGAVCSITASILSGNSLFWLLSGGSNGILEFDIERQSLAVIEKPADAHVTDHSWLQTLRTEENGLGLAMLTGPIIKIWARKVNSDGVVRWVLQKTIELDKLLPLGSRMHIPGTSTIWGFDEEAKAIFLSVDTDIFMVQLDSLQFRNIPKISSVSRPYYPYRNFYNAGLL